MPKSKLVLYRVGLSLSAVCWLALGLWELSIKNYFGGVGYPVMFVLGVFWLIKTKNRPRYDQLAFFWIFLVLRSYWIHKDYIRHKQDITMEKYGPEFNDHRLANSVPIIPSNWFVKYDFGDMKEWRVKDSSAEHFYKDVRIDSLYRLEFEDDEYILNPIDKNEREIDIRTHYASDNSIDSKFYTYNIGNSSKSITRAQADSIFKAENIRKDY